MIGLPRALGSVEALIRRYGAAVEKREAFRSLMQDCYRYAIPDRDIFTGYAPGQRRGTELFDSTAPLAVQEFASRIQSTICPAWRQWSKFAAGPALPREIRESDELAEQLDEQTDIFFGYINHSNWVSKSHEAFQDLAAGTGALTLELNEQRNGFVFDAVQPATLAIEGGPTGMVETSFVDRKCPPGHLLRMYPGLQLPPKWQKQMTDNPEKDVEYQVGSIYEPDRAEYWLVIFSKAEKVVVYVANYGSTAPLIVFRWSNAAGEDWGRGPIMAALPHIKTCNKVVEYVLRGAALTVQPPWTAVNDGILNPYLVRIRPDTVIPVGSNDSANPSLRQLMADARPDMAQLILEDMRRDIRRQMFSDPRRQEGAIQSATEVLIEDREFVQRIGSSFGRIQGEMIVRVINRGVSLLKSIGRMADIRVDGREITLKHMSPLARAQDQDELMSFQTAMQIAAPLGPEALNLALRTDKTGEWIFRKSGVPSEVLRTDAERAKILEEVKAIAAQQMQAQQAPQAA